MQHPISLHLPGRFATSPVQASALHRLLARCGALARAWREQRRVARAYRRDLQTLAGLSERDLADFCAPCWLRADVERCR
jgi:hypothetical protein